MQRLACHTYHQANLLLCADECLSSENDIIKTPRGTSGIIVKNGQILELSPT